MTWTTGTNLQMYIDGVKETAYSAISGNANNGIPGWTFRNTQFILGEAGTADSVSAWNGLIEEFGFWDREMSAAEIENLYARGIQRINFQVETSNDGVIWTGMSGSRVLRPSLAAAGRASIFRLIRSFPIPAMHSWWSTPPALTWLMVS